MGILPVCRTTVFFHAASCRPCEGNNSVCIVCLYGTDHQALLMIQGLKGKENKCSCETDGQVKPEIYFWMIKVKIDFKFYFQIT